jgi:hypothetical protein
MAQNKTMKKPAVKKPRCRTSASVKKPASATSTIGMQVVIGKVLQVQYQRRYRSSGYNDENEWWDLDETTVREIREAQAKFQAKHQVGRLPMIRVAMPSWSWSHMGEYQEYDIDLIRMTLRNVATHSTTRLIREVSHVVTVY